MFLHLTRVHRRGVQRKQVWSSTRIDHWLSFTSIGGGLSKCRSNMIRRSFPGSPTMNRKTITCFNLWSGKVSQPAWPRTDFSGWGCVLCVLINKRRTFSSLPGFEWHFSSWGQMWPIAVVPCQKVVKVASYFVADWLNDWLIHVTCLREMGTSCTCNLNTTYRVDGGCTCAWGLILAIWQSKLKSRHFLATRHV